MHRQFHCFLQLAQEEQLTETKTSSLYNIDTLKTSEILAHLRKGGDTFTLVHPTATSAPPLFLCKIQQRG